MRVIHHKDGNPSNNELNNLEIVEPPTEPRAGDRCVKCGVTDELQQGLCPECYDDANPRAHTATLDEPALTRNWNELSRYRQIIARHRIHDVSDIPNEEYTASWQDVKELRDQHTKLVAALRELLEIVEDEGHASNYVPQVAAARTALANEPEGEGVR